MNQLVEVVVTGVTSGVAAVLSFNLWHKTRFRRSRKQALAAAAKHAEQQQAKQGRPPRPRGKKRR